MKLACQTIIFGRRINDIDRVLDEVEALGFQGVEIAQRPDKLDRDPQFGIDDLLLRLEARKLHFLGLAGGSLEQRMEFCGDNTPEYLYLEAVDRKSFDLATSRGFTLALHPHMYKATNRLQEAVQLLRQYVGLKFILDTAHLLIAGDDPVDSVAATVEYLAALHLKDWSRRYGRAPHRYARGFCELGEGDVPLSNVMQALQDADYSGWVVIEQDHTCRSPTEALRESITWLTRCEFTSDLVRPSTWNDSNRSSFAQINSSAPPPSSDSTRPSAILRVRPAKDPRKNNLINFYDDGLCSSIRHGIQNASA